MPTPYPPSEISIQSFNLWTSISWSRDIHVKTKLWSHTNCSQIRNATQHERNANKCKEMQNMQKNQKHLEHIKQCKNKTKRYKAKNTIAKQKKQHCKQK